MLSSTLSKLEGKAETSRDSEKVNKESMTDQQNHPTAGRRRRHKSPAVTSHMHDLPLPSMRDYVGADSDGPSWSGEEKIQSE